MLKPIVAGVLALPALAAISSCASINITPCGRQKVTKVRWPNSQCPGRETFGSMREATAREQESQICIAT